MYKGSSVVRGLNLPKSQTLRFLSGTPKPYFEAMIPKSEELTNWLVKSVNRNAPFLNAQIKDCDQLKEQTILETCLHEKPQKDKELLDSPKAACNFGVNFKDDPKDSKEKTTCDRNARHDDSLLRVFNENLSKTVIFSGMMIGTCTFLITALSTSAESFL